MILRGSRVVFGTLIGSMLMLAASPADAVRRRRRRAPHHAPHHGPRHAPHVSAPNEPAAESDATIGANPYAAPTSATSHDTAPLTTASTPSGTEHASAQALPPPPPAGEIEPRRPVAIDAGLNFRLFARHLAFYQDLFSQFRSYDLDAWPAVSLAVAWYPGAHFTRGFLAHLGVDAAGEYLIGATSQDPNARSYATTSYAWTVGFRGRIPISASEVIIQAGYGSQAFSIAGNGPRGANDPGVPSVGYQYVRAGASARLALGERIAILLNASYLFVLTAGEISSAAYFPHATAGGVEAGIGVAVVLGAGVELRAGIDARRYFYSMNPNPGDQYVAGGALDHFLGATLGIAVRR